MKKPSAPTETPNFLPVSFASARASRAVHRITMSTGISRKRAASVSSQRTTRSPSSFRAPEAGTTSAPLPRITLTPSVRILWENSS